MEDMSQAEIHASPSALPPHDFAWAALFAGATHYMQVSGPKLSEGARLRFELLEEWNVLRSNISHGFKPEPWRLYRLRAL
mgnify:CR=1 FL=1